MKESWTSLHSQQKIIIIGLLYLFIFHIKMSLKLVFDTMPERNLDEALNFFRLMVNDGSDPNNYTYVGA